MTLTVERIEAGVLRLRMRSWRSSAVGYEASAYVLRGVLVDTGFVRAGSALRAVTQALDVRGAVVTHWHEDHSGNVPALASEGLPVLMHPAGEAILRERPAIGAYRRFTWGWQPRLVAPLVGFDPAPLQLIATPGHSPDHQVVWDAEHRIVAAGDLFLGVKVRVAHAHESPRLLVQSLRTVAALEPRLLLDGHRGPVEHATELILAKVAWLEETMGEILALSRAGVGEREIQHRVLGREPLVGIVSGGEYSKRAFVTAVLGEGEEMRR